jgi:hypothetical protein
MNKKLQWNSTPQQINLHAVFNNEAPAIKSAQMLPTTFELHYLYLHILYVVYQLLPELLIHRQPSMHC